MLRKPAQTQQSRVHPLIPTYQEALGGSPVYSSHLPIMATVPIDGSELKLLYYNIGYANVNPITKKVEGTEACANRYKRIGEGLKQCAQAQNLDVILLGPVWGGISDVGCKQWLKQLDPEGKEWSFRRRTEGVIFYKKEPLKEPETTKKRRRMLDQNFSSRIPHEISEFLFKGKKINICHVSNARVEGHSYSHALDVRFMLDAEEKYQELFKTSDSFTILLGDFGYRIAPLDGKPRNLTTSVAQDENHKQRQIPNCTKGIFYSRENSSEAKQLECQVVDIENGELFLNENMLVSEDENEQRIQHPFQPILCLDSTIPSDEFSVYYTLFNTDESATTSQKDRIVIQRTATINNEKGIVFGFFLYEP